MNCNNRSKKSLKTRNLDFEPFDITLDWKDQKDTIDKLGEIDTQIKDGPTILNY